MDLFNLFRKRRIFLDYASATPVLWRVQWAMLRYATWDFYNPNAIYQEGVKAREVVEECRTKIARILGVTKEGIVFTSGGTEANVWAVRGVKLGQIVVEEDVHPSVQEAAQGITGSGITLVSSVTTNNRLGRKIREERKKNNSEYPLLHIDASQSAQYFDVGLETLSCDLLTLDSAKLYGPKGIGVLAMRRGVKLNLPPQGTPPVPLIVGFTKALEIAVRDREAERVRLSSLSDLFVRSVKQALSEISITQTLPNVVNISLPNILPEFLVLSLDLAGLLVSAGPACHSHKPEPHGIHVMDSVPVRFSLGRPTSGKEIREAAKILCQTVQNLLK